MMTKHEFMAMSLPYDLQGVNEKGVRNTYAAVHYSYEFEPDFEKFTPILRPLSDLTKPIEHKEKKFVPIIELAKVAFTNSRFSFKLSEGLDKFVWVDDDWYNFKFYFKGYNFHYDGYNHFIPNRFKLHQKLIEWHFDIADLISKGEAIDVNTLETNPYK